MRTKHRSFRLAGLAIVFALTGVIFAQDNNTPNQPSGPNDIVHSRTVAADQGLKLKGIVIKRTADTFTLREQNGVETVVTLTDQTRVTTVRKGLFRRDKPSGISYILRGLRLEAEGIGNADGQFLAASIRFNEQDLWTAQALQVSVDPVESLAQSNERRIGDTEQNQVQLSGQIDEVSGIAQAAGAAAKNAQATADQAQSDAMRANRRINGLDDYDVIKSITVLFKPGSAVLWPAAKEEIDEAAAAVKSQNLEGWVVAVVGYADSTGNSARNRSLSERRAQAVIRYLVEKYDLPLRRLVQPFGYGSLNPVADNASSEGRAKNRRVELKVLINRGINPQADLSQVP
jgi:outer membrane protein OmpA-like peptidoglycan-associated protein